MTAGNTSVFPGYLRLKTPTRNIYFGYSFSFRNNCSTFTGIFDHVQADVINYFHFVVVVDVFAWIWILVWILLQVLKTNRIANRFWRKTKKEKCRANYLFNIHDQLDNSVTEINWFNITNRILGGTIFSYFKSGKQNV